MEGGQTFDKIMERLLGCIDDKFDKRPSSMIYNALAPAALELAELYAQVSSIYMDTFADTAHGKWLELRTIEQGIIRRDAVAAVRKGIFTKSNGAPAVLASGYRFKTIDGDSSVIYKVGKELKAGQYELTCETAGEIGNGYIGDLLPVTNISGLGTAILTDIIVPGEEIESDESLLARYMDRINEKGFGGNVADYKRWMQEQEGVGPTKVYPVWAGGGTVKLVFLDSNYQLPAPELIWRVQTAIDPEQNQGEGVGLAPIGHVVTVRAPDACIINVQLSLVLADKTVGQLAEQVKSTLKGLLLDLKKVWEEQAIVVRVAHIDARLLNIAGVVDIQKTLLNGQPGNIALATDAVPVLGEVVVNGQKV